MPVPSADQREHIEITADDRGPAPLEERQAAPQDHRGRQGELNPDQGPAREEVGKRQARNHFGHREDEERDREDKADPEPAAHVVELGIDVLVRRDGHRLQGHAANRARARTVADDLRVHRAGVGRSMGRGRGRLVRATVAPSWLFALAITQVAGRIGAKLFDAMPATEIVSPAIVVDRAGGGRGNHVHAADGVLDRGAGVVVWVKWKDGQAWLVRVHGIEIPLGYAPALALGDIFIQRRDFLRSSLSQTLKKDSRAAWALSRWDASKLLAAWTKAGSWACSASTCSISRAATTAS